MMGSGHKPTEPRRTRLGAAPWRKRLLAALAVGGISLSWATPAKYPLDTRFAGAAPADLVLISHGGTNIAYCSLLACITSPSIDHMRTSALFAARTADDGHSQENTVSVQTEVGTGFTPAWHERTRYAEGQNVSANGQVYRAVRAGISGEGGLGPYGTGSKLVDGSVTWAWINASAINGKVGLYNEMATIRGGGASWGQANNIHLQPGAVPTFNINTEFDFQNDAATCVFGTTCTNLYVSVNGPFQSTSAVSILTGNADSSTVPATHWGLRLSGARLASDADMEDDAGGAVGLGFGVTGIGPTPVHSRATIEDASTSPYSLLVGGRHDLADIVLNADSNIGIQLLNSYRSAQISGIGWSVDPAGRIAAVAFRGTLTTPTSSRASCQPGQFTDDADFHYVCVAHDRWKRVALSDF